MSSERINLYTLIAIMAFIILTLGRVLWVYFGFYKNGKKLWKVVKGSEKWIHSQLDTSNSVPISHPVISKLYDQYSQTMIGQNHVFVWLMWCWLAGGHCLLTGLPGTGKTQAVKTWVQLMWLDMGRVQGTSDLLPADITGSLIYNPKTSEFDTIFGPIMHECVLVDEINRMPSKTQSALLQAMAEWHIIIGQQTYDLPQHFTIFATQNPHDRVGTFPLPQAQLDRFMCQVTVAPVNLEQQGRILNQINQNVKLKSPLRPQGIPSGARGGAEGGGVWIIGHAESHGDLFHDIVSLQTEYNQITVPESITSSVAQLLQDQWLSSRAGQHIIAFARALALMSNKGQVDQSDCTIALSYTIGHRLLIKA
jgi:hypothetical protein